MTSVEYVNRPHGGKRELVFFGFTRMEDMLSKGNAWYVTHYRSFFDRVAVVYLSGGPILDQERDGVRLVSLGSGNGWWNLLISPLRLWWWARSNKPTDFLTADVVFSWWLTLVLRWRMGVHVVLMPVSMPDLIYKSSGKTLTGLPRWIEKWMIRVSFKVADRVWTGRCFGDFVSILRAYPLARNKLVVTDGMVEALPTPSFLQSLEASQATVTEGERPFRLIYVGRLSPEKLVKDLIEALTIIRQHPVGREVCLTLVGEGPEMSNLQRLAKERGVSEAVDFVGVLPNEDLPAILTKAHVFVSTLTGTSLREAALVGLPIVAYETDWVRGVLSHGENVLFALFQSPYSLSDQVLKLVSDIHLRSRLRKNIKILARSLWSPDHLFKSLEEVFQFSEVKENSV